MHSLMFQIYKSHVGHTLVTLHIFYSAEDAKVFFKDMETAVTHSQFLN